MTSQKRSLVNLCFNLSLAIFLSCCQAPPAPLPILPTFNMPTSTASMTVLPVIERPSSSPSPSVTPMPVIEQASATETPMPTNTQIIIPTNTSVVCVPPNGHSRWAVYTVQSGDTLFSLATSTNTSVEEIQKANCLPGTIIYNGQPIYLPFIPVYIPPAVTIVPPTAPPPGDPRIEVEPGSGSASTVTTFTFKIRDFDPFEAVTVIVKTSVGVEVYRSSVTMDGSGNFDYPWVIPVGLAPGPYVVWPFGLDGNPGKSGGFLVIP